MAKRKTMIRFFTIADYLEEECWLRKTHNAGWRLIKIVPPCFYIFEECRPEDVIYRLDYKNNRQGSDYMQMVNDFGWEYCTKCLGWLCFKKAASAVENAGDAELFSDNESRLEMIAHIVKTRMLPFLILFLCTVVPNFYQAIDSKAWDVLAVIYGVLFWLYVFLLIYCGVKLRKIKQELK